MTQADTTIAPEPSTTSESQPNWLMGIIVWQVILALGQGYTVGEAFATTYGIDYEEVLKVASDYEVDLSRKKS